MNKFALLTENIEKKIGLTIEEIRKISPYKIREHLEKKRGKTIQYITEFPFIGRGNILRDRFVEREKINKEIDHILR